MDDVVVIKRVLWPRVSCTSINYITTPLWRHQRVASRLWRAQREVLREYKSKYRTGVLETFELRVSEILRHAAATLLA